MVQENKKTILIVEDEASYRKILTDKLLEENFDVISADNGEDGLILAAARRPDLILLDIIMPKIDGVTMLRELRKYDQWGKSVPVFILSVLPSSDVGESRYVNELEPTYYLEKINVKVDDLVKKIKERIL